MCRNPGHAASCSNKCSSFRNISKYQIYSKLRESLGSKHWVPESKIIENLSICCLFLWSSSILHPSDRIKLTKVSSQQTNAHQICRGLLGGKNRTRPKPSQNHSVKCPLLLVKLLDALIGLILESPDVLNGSKLVI